jgi:hypothetical protein
MVALENDTQKQGILNSMRARIEVSDDVLHRKIRSTPFSFRMSTE